MTRSMVFDHARAGRAFALLTGLLVFGSGADAQQGQRRGIWIDAGVRAGYYTAQDELATPLRYSGIGVGQLGVAIGRESAGTRHELEVWFGERNIGTADRFAGQDETLASVGDAAYTFARRLGSSPWWVGASAAVRVQHHEYEFRSGGAEAYFYNAGFEAHGSRDLALGPDTRLRVSARVPVVMWAARPPWSTVDEGRLQSDNDFTYRFGEGRVRWLGDVLAVRARAQLDHRLSDHVGAWAAGRLGYQRLPDDQRFASGQLGLDVGLSFGWGAS